MWGWKLTHGLNRIVELDQFESRPFKLSQDTIKFFIISVNVSLQKEIRRITTVLKKRIRVIVFQTLDFVLEQYENHVVICVCVDSSNNRTTLNPI